MIFLGNTFALDKYTLDETPTDLKNIKNIKLQNGIYDQLYGTSNIDLDDFENILPDWDFDTFISANFNHNIFGGNVDFSVETTDFIRIKRREKGTYDWITLTSIKIEKEEDFSFIYYDNLNSANTIYEYALVPVKNNIEGIMTINEVNSDFDGMYIVGNDKMYFGFINLTYPAPTLNKPSAILVPLDDKYPTIVNNSLANYYNDTCSATFVDTKEESEWGWDLENGWKYRDEFKKWLHNGKPKILKYYTGRTWLVGISGEISDKINLVEENTVTTFNWYEIGDFKNEKHLKTNGFIEGEKTYV